MVNKTKNKNNNKSNKNSSNSLVFGRWPQTKIVKANCEVNLLGLFQIKIKFAFFPYYLFLSKTASIAINTGAKLEFPKSKSEFCCHSQKMKNTQFALFLFYAGFYFYFILLRFTLISNLNLRKAYEGKI